LGGVEKGGSPLLYKRGEPSFAYAPRGDVVGSFRAQREISYSIERGNSPPFELFPEKQKSFSWSVIPNEVRNLLLSCFLGGVLRG